MKASAGQKKRSRTPIIVLLKHIVATRSKKPLPHSAYIGIRFGDRSRVACRRSMIVVQCRSLVLTSPPT